MLSWHLGTLAGGTDAGGKKMDELRMDEAIDQQIGKPDSVVSAEDIQVFQPIYGGTHIYKPFGSTGPLLEGMCSTLKYVALLSGPVVPNRFEGDSGMSIHGKKTGSGSSHAGCTMFDPRT